MSSQWSALGCMVRNHVFNPERLLWASLTRPFQESLKVIEKQLHWFSVEFQVTLGRSHPSAFVLTYASLDHCDHCSPVESQSSWNYCACAMLASIDADSGKPLSSLVSISGSSHSREGCSWWNLYFACVRSWVQSSKQGLGVSND